MGIKIKKKTMKAKRSRLSAKDKDRILDLIMSLKRSQIKVFLQSEELAVSGNKADYRTVLKPRIHGTRAFCDRALEFVDSHIIWGKQHVFLLNSPDSLAGRWQDEAWVGRHFRKNKLDHLRNQRTPLVLPKDWELASITATRDTVSALAVKRHEYTERSKDLDFEEQTDAASKIFYRAYVEHTTRQWVRFEWDLRTNAAMLQIGQLHGREKYKDVRSEITELLSDWIDLATFDDVNLANAIKRIDDACALGEEEFRLQHIDFKTINGRHLSATSKDAQSPVHGDTALDAALKEMKRSGVGHLGNVWWLKQDDGPLDRDFHLFIVAEHQRINITRAHTEGQVRHVLQRLRSLSI